MNYSTLQDEIKLRYLITHETHALKKKLEEIFGHVASASYDIDDITSIFQLDIVCKKQNANIQLSIADITVLGMPYLSVKEFQDALVDEEGILEVCKTVDTFKMEENRELLKELYNMEMKIREIYTVLTRLQNANLDSSRVRLTKEYKSSRENFRRRLMNEFFFIEFSDYKNVDKRKEAKLENLLDALLQVKRMTDIGKIIPELSYPTLHLEERFNELARIPEAIGRVENFRNVVAHNRYASDDDLSNFERARNIIDSVYATFIAEFRNGSL